MANINAHLPSSIAVPFHPPTENLQHDNLIKPIIPKTDIISSYAKFRDEQERPQFSSQSRSILQDEGKKTVNEGASQESSAQQKRSQFFARRRKQFVSESKYETRSLKEVDDFKDVISVIQTRYKNAVSPSPDPAISFAI